MRKIVGVLCWYDEQPAWLASAVASFCRLGLDHMVCVDGAYELYPEGRPRSGAEQHQALQEIVRPFGVGLTIHIPNRLWASEMEKRSFAFEVAELVSEEQDWYAVFDADEMAEDFDLRRALMDADSLAAECVSWERLDGREAELNGGLMGSKSVRRFYRALRGLRVEGNHTTYRAGDLVLRGFSKTGLVGSEKLPMRVEHRRNHQDPQRRLAQETYYRLRDREGAEQRECHHCDQRSVMTVPVKFQRASANENGRGRVTCQWVELCEAHLPKTLKETERRLSHLVDDPREVLIRLGFDVDRAHQLAKTSAPPARPGA